MARKKIEIVTIGGIESKECTRCGEVKALSDYYNRKRGLGGKDSICKKCEADRKCSYSRDNREQLNKYRRKYELDNKERISERNKEYREKNKERIMESNKRYREENKDRIAAYRKGNKDIYKASNQRRRAKKKLLNCTITSAQTAELISKGCALTGDASDIHLDHFIPLAWGHGGTIIENMIPLRGDLNASKNASNPFEWIKREDIRQQIDMDRWHTTVRYLADLNRMTPKEFEEYVYWCEENKRDLTMSA